MTETCETCRWWMRTGAKCSGILLPGRTKAEFEDIGTVPADALWWYRVGTCSEPHHELGTPTGPTSHSYYGGNGPNGNGENQPEWSHCYMWKKARKLATRA